MPVGKARIARAGRDLTIVATVRCCMNPLARPRRLRRSGFEIEVVESRTVKPLDTATVAGIRRQNRPAFGGRRIFPWGGVTAEVIARVSTEGFHLLDAAPARLKRKDTPIPYHPNFG